MALSSAIMTLQGPKPQVSLLGRLAGLGQPIRGIGDVYIQNPRGASNPRGHLLGLAGFLDPVTLHPLIFFLGVIGGIWYAGKKLKK